MSEASEGGIRIEVVRAGHLATARDADGGNRKWPSTGSYIRCLTDSPRMTAVSMTASTSGL
ncbi:MAG: hypothetical protein ACLSTO_00955 [Bilophila wadsworthia]